DGQEDDLDAAGAGAAHGRVEGEPGHGDAEEGEDRAGGADGDAELAGAEEQEGGAAADGAGEEGEGGEGAAEHVLGEAPEEEQPGQVHREVPAVDVEEG